VQFFFGQTQLNFGEFYGLFLDVLDSAKWCSEGL